MLNFTLATLNLNLRILNALETEIVVIRIQRWVKFPFLSFPTTA